MKKFKYIKSKQKASKIIKSGKSENWSGRAGLMCPSCMNIIKTTISYRLSISNMMNNVEDIDQFIEYRGTCPICNEIVKFEIIDINMVDIINILNDKGYYTAFCCEGHVDDDGFTNPYVYFYISNDIKILNKYPLPKTWYIDDDSFKNDVFIIRDHIIEEIDDNIDDDEAIKWFKENWNQEESMKDLYEWAESLPKKDKYIRDMLFKYIKKHGEFIIFRNAAKINYGDNTDEEV